MLHCACTLSSSCWRSMYDRRSPSDSIRAFCTATRFRDTTHTAPHHGHDSAIRLPRHRNTDTIPRYESHGTATRTLYRKTNTALRHDPHDIGTRTINRTMNTAPRYDTATRKNASFVLSVASLLSTIGEVVGFTLAHDTCEQG